MLEKSGVDPFSIDGVGLTGQMHGLVLLDAAGNVLHPAILWNDQRTQAIMAGGGDQAAGAVGTGVVPPGIVGLTVGVSGVVFAATPSERRTAAR